MQIKPFFDPVTSTISYVVSDPETKHCAIIDSVHDFDLHSGRLSTASADEIINYISAENLTVEWILETHVHADHLTAASYLKSKLGGKIGIGVNIKKVLSHWIPVFNTAADTPADASQFDKLFADGEEFNIGNLTVKVMYTPGHTPDSISYVINDAVFVGDTLFMPNLGTARTDFPGGSATTLYQSIRKILSLPDKTRIFACHDYPATGHEATWESTVAEQKSKNIMINDAVTEDAYVAARNKRDATLSVPKLLLPSLQVNIRAGELGLSENNGTHYIKIPIIKS